MAESALDRCYNYKIPEKLKEEITSLNIKIEMHYQKAYVAENEERKKEKERLSKASKEKFQNLAIKKEKQDKEPEIYNDAIITGTVNSYQHYLTLYPNGKYILEIKKLLENQKDNNAWEKAKNKRSTSAYYVYLETFPNGNHATSAKETIKHWDKKAYEKATADGTQDALNYYLNNYPRGEYRRTVRNKLTQRKEYDVYMYAKKHNYIEDYETYIRKYPTGKYLLEVNRVIENSYYKFGNEAYALKNYIKAKKHYEAYISKFPNGTYSYEVRNKIIKCQRKLNQRSASFLMYTYDSQSSIGISIGDINKNRAGYYLNLKMNPKIFTGFNVLYKIDDTGSHDRPGDVVRTGGVKYANISLSGGVTFKIVYPLWAYIGGGGGYFPVYEHANTYYSTGEFWEEDWLKNTDQTKFGLFPEVGLKLKVSNALVIKYGIMYRKVIIHQFGVGFQL